MNILGIDFGLKNVGIALFKNNIIFPYASLKYKSFNDLILQIKEILSIEEINLILIGDPFLNINIKSSLSFHLNAFIEKMNNSIENIEILRIDEYNTTNESIELLRKFNYKKSKIKNTKDMISACKIIENYQLKKMKK